MKAEENHSCVIGPQKFAVNIEAVMDRLLRSSRVIGRMGALRTLRGRGRSAAKLNRIGGTAAILVALLAASGCSREDAVEHLKKELPVDSIQIVHARFPCRSPDLHLFGYRFNAILLQQREGGYGDICWDFSSRQWSWQMLPDSSLARFNQKK
jgi:hypothetical protein